MSRSMAPAVVGILLLLVTACSLLPVNFESPRVALVGLSVVSMDLFEQRYRVRLRIQNPNDAELPIRGIDFRLDINGESFADGVSNQAVTLPAFGEQLMELEVSSSLLKVFRQLQSLEDRLLAGFEYRIRGHVASTAGRRLPFDFSGRLETPRPTSPGQVKKVDAPSDLSTNSVDNFVDQL